MTIRSARPVATIVATDTTWTTQDDATSVSTDGQLSILGDSDLTTGLRHQGAHVDTGDLTAPFAAKIAAGFTLPTGLRIRAVRPTLAIRQQPSTGAALISVTPSTDAHTYAAVTLGLNGVTAQRDLGLGAPWITEESAGVEWTATLVGQLKAAMTLIGKAMVPEYSVTIAEMGFDIDVMFAPVVSGLSPASGYVDDPIVLGWVYDGAGDVQKKYELKFFTDAVHGGGGFDPATSPALLTATGGSSSSATIDSSPLTRGDAVWWAVRVAKDFNGQDWWSDWADAVKVTFNNRPTVTVTAPTDPLTTTSRPVVEWTTSDDSSAPQTAWQARIYVEPLAGWPSSGLPAGDPYDSGEGLGTTASWRVNRQLIHGATFRAYVRAQSRVSGSTSGLYSLWSFIEFENLSEPAAGPTFVGEYDETNLRVELTLTTIATDPTTTFYEIERSTDDGATWTTLPLWLLVDDTWTLTDSSRMALGDASTAVTLYDGDLPLDRDVQYRATSIATASSFDVPSDPTVIAPGTFASTCRLFLCNPLDLVPPVPVRAQDQWLSRTTSVPALTAKPFGRTEYIVQQGLPGGDLFTLNLIGVDRAELAPVLDLLLSRQTLLLMMEGRSVFVRVNADLARQEYLWDAAFAEGGGDDVQKIAVPFAQVADPR